MVHYDPPVSAAPRPPVLCPKCGSHRTEIVGRSHDGTVLIVRCNVCGERSQMPNPEHADALGAEGLEDFFDDRAAEPDATYIVAPMKGFVVGGDFRRRLRTAWSRA